MEGIDCYGCALKSMGFLSSKVISHNADRVKRRKERVWQRSGIEETGKNDKRSVTDGQGHDGDWGQGEQGGQGWWSMIVVISAVWFPDESDRAWLGIGMEIDADMERDGYRV